MQEELSRGISHHVYIYVRQRENAFKSRSISGHLFEKSTTSGRAVATWLGCFHGSPAHGEKGDTGRSLTRASFERSKQISLETFVRVLTKLSFHVQSGWEVARVDNFRNCKSVADLREISKREQRVQVSNIDIVG